MVNWSRPNVKYITSCYLSVLFGKLNIRTHVPLPRTFPYSTFHSSLNSCPCLFPAFLLSSASSFPLPGEPSPLLLHLLPPVPPHFTRNISCSSFWLIILSAADLCCCDLGMPFFSVLNFSLYIVLFLLCLHQVIPFDPPVTFTPPAFFVWL